MGAEGKYVEAVAEFREVLKLREKILGSESPDTMTSRNNLAVMLLSEGKYSESEAQIRELITTETKVLGPENPDTLGSRNNLADALARQGKYAEAEAETAGGEVARSDQWPGKPGDARHPRHLLRDPGGHWKICRCRSAVP